MRCPLQSFQHRPLTDLSRVRFNLRVVSLCGWLKVSFYTVTRSFSGKIYPMCGLQSYSSRSKLVVCKDAGTVLSRGDASFQYFGSFCAIRKEDKQVESSEIHSEKYEFPIYTTHRDQFYSTNKKIFGTIVIAANPKQEVKQRCRKFQLFEE